MDQIYVFDLNRIKNLILSLLNPPQGISKLYCDAPKILLLFPDV